MRRACWTAVLLGVVLFASIVSNASAAQAAHLRIGVFNQTLTALAAQSQGFLAEQDLTVEYLQVSSSTQQFQYLRDGQYDLIHSAPDNTVNYRLNDSNALGGAFDVQAFMGLDEGQNLALATRPGIGSIADLRGKTIAVDAPDSGFAYVLYEMLRRHGLERGTDYQLAIAGGNPLRYEALLAGEFDATLLNAGFETRAADAGFPILQTVQQVASPYLGSVASGREAWLKRNRGVVVRLIRAYRKANRWAFDPRNREAAIALLMSRPNTTRSLAERLYELQLQRGVGILRDLRIDRAGLLTNLELRERFDGFDRPHNLRYLASPASGLYDGSYLRQARRE